MSYLVKVSQSYNTEKHKSKKPLSRQPDNDSKRTREKCPFYSVGPTVMSCVCLKTHYNSRRIVQ